MPVGISVDTPEGVLAVKEAMQIPFELLSDPQLAVHRQFNVLNTLDPATLEKYEEWRIALEQWSGEDHHTIAIPSLFLIDEQRVIRWAHAQPNYRERPAIDQLLQVLGKVN